MKKIILIIICSIMCFINYYRIEVNNICIKTVYPDEIIIPKIDLDQNFFAYYETNIDNGIIYLKESDFNTDFYILAAHSGNADISYFKNINKLEKGDKIYLNARGKKLIFDVDKKYYVRKNGIINLNKDNNLLYLTTCDKHNNNRQLVIKCVKKV